MKNILITGAFGLVGTDLIIELKRRFPDAHIVSMAHAVSTENGTTQEKGDVIDKSRLKEILEKYEISEMYHLAGLLSVGGEKDPPRAWNVNVEGLRNVFDLALLRKMKVFWPSSIAAFGPTTPKNDTPQHTILEPTTIYGVTKVTGELLCQYYFLRYGLDVRSLRYPGLIAYKAPPGDGTTEYSVHIFYGALKENRYTCFLKEDSRLPMMYIDDAVKGTIDLMEAQSSNLTVRTSYNFSAINFTPRELVAEIQKQMPAFTCTYEPDHRQKIADSWPQSIDDTFAREEWGWKHEYDLQRLVAVMLENLKNKLQL
ncbi:NAD-dependent epimerase [Candidatus Roizmanbacteria bacterium CG10_big_fil_rev_8_21_14_0_10_39_6]|uniref:NAD-dependent epimerase n=1 Tax=Candidatus Roizmanbacteria bacterium CG10_big_fil_rev_8_21_14_0_10_39_6 TaxID=1974853 RepID=A0A2M8KRV9_9BACT|nr:MAG: NAD-dependent epimerase [Candidatus Roizmanbacteria bacterium CG10_big_fil_rev_8_21_14_0_10_39_6]